VWIFSSRKNRKWLVEDVGCRTLGAGNEPYFQMIVTQWVTLAVNAKQSKLPREEASRDQAKHPIDSGYCSDLNLKYQE
jgi:hypothetical protein